MFDCTSTLAGNLTRDPERRLTTTGRAVAAFGLAVNRRYQAGGEWQEQTSFIDVVVWGELADHVHTSFHKGDRVIVTGRLEQRTWETPEGAKRSKVEVVASDVGASVRFATVGITKAARPEPAGVAAAGASTEPAASAMPATSPPGEEPF